MVRTKITSLVAVAACAGGAAAVISTSTAAAAPTASAASGLRLTLQKTPIGRILFQGGVVVYDFAHDRKNTNTCTKSSGCAATWPPLLSNGKPTAGPGVKASLIGLIKYGSKQQVTYAGRPLYNYIMNSSSTSYVGYSQYGGRWDGLTANGVQVK
jgi:predicted lipoprotein with Yx(FWY)xxD motif